MRENFHVYVFTYAAKKSVYVKLVGIESISIFHIEAVAVDQ